MQSPRAAILALLLAGCGGGGGGSARPVDQWALVWQDEFVGTALDTSAWTPSVQGENYNEEDQAYVPANATVVDGHLVLTARQEHWEGRSGRADHPDAQVVREYTSAEVNGSRTWTYGRFEMRARMAGNQGLLSALWMTPADGDWPPEIDIAEVLGGSTDTVTVTNHFGTPEAHRMVSSPHSAGVDLAADYHVYAVEWEPDALRWYLDGALVHTSTAGVPQEPFILRLSLPVGPTWGGEPDETTQFPQVMLVDWVRVYQ